MKDLSAFGTKLWTITLLYNRPAIVQEAIGQYYKTRGLGGEGFQHVFVQHHYPFDKKRTREETKKVCEGVGGLYLDPGKNLGLHDGFNWAMAQLPIEDHHYVIMYDGDNFPVNPGWDDALVRTLFYDEKLTWTTLWNPEIKNTHGRLRWERRTIVDHIRVWTPSAPYVKTVSAWKAGRLKEIGGFSEPTGYWGHLESAMHNKIRPRGWLDAFLPDYYESSAPSHRIDPEYHAWKVAHAHTFKVKVDLEQWLRDTGRAHVIGPE